jgi:hypothetical protein
LRVVNIPIELRVSDGHAFPFFSTENAFLGHGDDPYNRFFTSLSSPLPVEDLLVEVKDATWKGKVGFVPLNLALERVPRSLLEMYCSDLKYHLPKENGQVFKNFRRFFSMRDLEENKLWARLEEKRKNEGCSRENI